jgi:hypothetical protein
MFKPGFVDNHEIIPQNIKDSMANFITKLMTAVELLFYRCQEVVKTSRFKKDDEMIFEEPPLKIELERLMHMLVGDYTNHSSIFNSLRDEYCHSYRFVYEAARQILFEVQDRGMSFVTLLLRMSRYFYLVDYKQHSSEFIMNFLLFFSTAPKFKLKLLKDVAKYLDEILMPHHLLIPMTPQVSVKDNNIQEIEKQKVEEEYRPFKPLNIRELVLQAVPIKFEDDMYREEGTTAEYITTNVIKNIEKIVGNMIRDMKIKGLYDKHLWETHHHLETINYLHNIILEMCKDSDKYCCLFADQANVASYFNVVYQEQNHRLKFSMESYQQTSSIKFSKYLGSKVKDYHKNTLYKFTLMIHYGMHIPFIETNWLDAAQQLIRLKEDDLKVMETINNHKMITVFNGVFSEMILERTFTLFAVSGIYLKVREQTCSDSKQTHETSSLKISICDDGFDRFHLNGTHAAQLAATFCRSIAFMKENQRGLWVNWV